MPLITEKSDAVVYCAMSIPEELHPQNMGAEPHVKTGKEDRVRCC
jgi:hypothetical protein